MHSQQFSRGLEPALLRGERSEGMLLAAGDGRDALHPGLRFFLAIGALGAFTTFSAFGNETVTLMRSGGLTAALLNVACNVVLGLGAVWVGHTLVKAVSTTA